MSLVQTAASEPSSTKEMNKQFIDSLHSPNNLEMIDKMLEEIRRGLESIETFFTTNVKNIRSDHKETVEEMIKKLNTQTNKLQLKAIETIAIEETNKSCFKKIARELTNTMLQTAREIQTRAVEWHGEQSYGTSIYDELKALQST